MTPRFENVSCSQCGHDFGPGDHGFSHCENHTGLPRCGSCGLLVESVNEADQCEECVQAEMDRMWRDYQFGRFTRPHHEIDAELIDAGRGHLVRR